MTNAKPKQNLKPSGGLVAQFETPSWELLILIAFFVTVFGIALRKPLQTFPIATNSSIQTLEQDPYDIRSERNHSDTQNRVATGF